MIKQWFTRYNPRYPRFIVYMLQACEYNVRDYCAWINRTSDFSHVERRKQLVKTPKALVLFVIAWLLVLLLCIGIILIVWHAVSPFKYAFVLLAVLVAPFYVAYGILVPLLVLQFVFQIPAERRIIRKAKSSLKSHRGVRIAIAGSFGKTTFREILKTILSESKKVAAPPNSYNTPLGISQFIRGLHGDEDVLLFELGEYYPGDIRKLCEFVEPQMGVITGVNEAHLQKFKSLERTEKTIFELADWLGAKPLYVNGESLRARANALPQHSVYSRNGTGTWKVEHPTTGLDGTSFTLVQDGQSVRCTSRLLGLHILGSIVAAIDIAARIGVPLEKIQQGIERTKPFDHRLEPKVDASGVITLDDSYNGNPDGVQAAIAFLQILNNHRRFYVTPGLVEMGDHTEDVHKTIGMQLAHAGIEKVVLIKNSVTGYIAQGLHDAHYAGDILWFDDALAAFAALPHLTVSGDVVLLQNDWPDQYE